MFVNLKQISDSVMLSTDIKGCGHLFTASDSASKLKIMQNCDETGLMGVNYCYEQSL